MDVRRLCCGDYGGGTHIRAESGSPQHNTVRNILPSVADFRPPGGDLGPLDAVQLGRPRLLVVGSAARTDAEDRAVFAQGVR